MEEEVWVKVRVSLGKNKSFPKSQTARGEESWLGDVGNGKRPERFLKQENDVSRTVP